jgi:hypothetical protein
MLEQISELVKQYGKEAVIDNPDIPNEHNSAVLAEATNTITGGMQNMLAGGGLQDIISMFTGGGGNNQGNQTSGIGGLIKNPMVSMMIGHLVSKLVGKFNMNPGQASQVANNLIPNVLNGLVTRTASSDPSDTGFDLNDLIGSLTGAGYHQPGNPWGATKPGTTGKRRRRHCGPDQRLFQLTTTKSRVSNKYVKRSFYSNL